MKIRKIVTTVEETHLEMRKKIDPPTRRAASTAVIENPFAGQYQEDLDSLITIGCLLYTSPSPRDRTRSRMPSSA